MSDDPTWDDHERIWLEGPQTEPSEKWDDRTWCTENQWGEYGVLYVRADIARSFEARAKKAEAERDAAVIFANRAEGERNTFSRATVTAQINVAIWKDRAEKAEAELAQARNHIRDRDADLERVDAELARLREIIHSLRGELN